jgi:hypothetical protein
LVASVEIPFAAMLSLLIYIFYLAKLGSKQTQKETRRSGLSTVL